MRPLVVIIGTILIIAAFVVMGIFIIGPAVIPSLDEAPALRAVLQPILCKSNEKLAAEYSTYSTHPGNTTRSVEMSCVNNENQARDVSGQGIVYGIVGYLVPFLTGLFMVILGSGTKRQRYTLSSSTPMVHDMFGQGISAAPSSTAERLQELKSVYEAGLITESEYEKKKQEILKQL